jgi:predicted Zn-dependent protease with MMP-like domain
MDYVEKFIIDNWKKIPQSFKDRIGEGLDLILNDVDLAFPKMIVKILETDTGKTIVFYKQPLEKLLKKQITDLLIKELVHCFGFDEQEAYELLSKT